MSEKPGSSGDAGGTGIVKPPVLAGWLLIAGLAVGLLTLVIFVGFATFVAVGRMNYTCSVARLLAVVFAIGVAGFAAAFLGGSAGAQGNWNLMGMPLRFQAAGGSAVLLGAYLAFSWLSTPACGGTPGQMMLEFEGVPNKLSFTVDRLWSQKKVTPGFFDKTSYNILVQEAPATEIVLSSVDTTTKQPFVVCKLKVLFADNTAINAQLKGYKFGDPVAIGALQSIIQLELRSGWSPPEQDTGKDSDQNCFEFGEQTVNGAIAVSLDTGNVEFATQPPSDTTAFDYNQPASRPGRAVSFVTAAYADDAPLFTDVLAALGDSTPATREAARGYLEDNFSHYEAATLDELFKPQQDPNVLADLISGVIAGVGQANGGALQPGQRRDLSRPLPFGLNARANALVQMTGDPSVEVEKQARRFVQRFPVDVFDKIYRGILTKAASGDCAVDADHHRAQSLLYGAGFFYYNRIVQLYYNISGSTEIDQMINLPQAQQQEANNDAELVLASANKCLDPPLKVDAAVVDVALATLFSKSNGLHDMAVQSAKDFLQFVDGQSGSYYLAAHVQQMQALSQS